MSENSSSSLPPKKKYETPLQAKTSYKPVKNKDKYNNKKDVKKDFKDQSYGKKNVYLSEDLYNNVVLIMEEKFKNITLSPLENKVINEFYQIIKHNKDNERNTRQPDNKMYEKKPCNFPDDCIVWYCRYLHSDKRAAECKTRDCADGECPNLHRDQALCHNPNHPENCSMAHRVEDLKK